MLTFAIALALLFQAPDYESDGLKALDAKNYAEAIALFQKAVAAAPRDFSSHFYLGLALSMAGNDAQAIPEYRTTLELKPGLYEAQLNLGISLVQSKDFAAAGPVLTSAAEQKPNEVRPALYLAEAYLGLEQWPKAAEWYRKAGTLDPSYRTGLLKIAAAQESRGQLDDAVKLYAEFPTDDGAQERMGAILLQQRKIPEAIAALEPVVGRSPTAANIITLAQAYVANKQPEQAEPLAGRASSAAPNDNELRMFHARLLRDLRKFPEASQEFLAAAQRDPKLVEAWNELAGVFTSLEQYPQALTALDRVKGLGAEKAGNFYLRALVLDKMHQDKLAVENYNKFLELSKGELPDQEFIARQRVRTLDKSKR